jgi:glycosyltransferase involved in cell wall biosynthesis
METGPTLRASTVVLWAFICDPHSGSEGGLGWNWAQALARRGYEVHLVTSTAFRAALEEQLALESGQGRVKLHFTRTSDKALARGYKGHLGFYYDYLHWQQQALRESRRLGLDAAEVKHHVSFGAILLGSRLAQLGPPFVFGPAGGGHLSAPELRSLLGSSVSRDTARTIMVKHLPAVLPTTRQTVPRADLLLAANAETAALAQRLGARRVERMAPEGIDQSLLASSARSSQPGSEQIVLWVGRFLPHKAPSLAVEAFSHVRRAVPAARLVMVGDGPKQAETRARARELGLNGAVEFTGTLDWPGVFALYDKADLLLFTSIRDTSGATALEAAARGLPIVALSHSGGGGCDHFPDAGAIKVTAMPAASLGARLGGAVAEVLLNSDDYERRSTAVLRFAAGHTWDAKVSTMSNWYAELSRARAEQDG